jgi:hypothetical protein
MKSCVERYLDAVPFRLFPPFAVRFGARLVHALWRKTFLGDRRPAEIRCEG